MVLILLCGGVYLDGWVWLFAVLDSCCYDLLVFCVCWVWFDYGWFGYGTVGWVLLVSVVCVVYGGWVGCASVICVLHSLRLLI